MSDFDVDQFKEKYKARISDELKGKSEGDIKPITTNDYETFKNEYLPKHLSWYEKACNLSAKILNIKPDKRRIPEYQEAIDICHLNITPTGATSFPILFVIGMILFGLTIGIVIPVLMGNEPIMFFTVVAIIGGLAMMMPISNLPFLFANNWRMKASNQMVLCIFYIVTYMRHTSNFELGIDFAAEHLSPPLSIDLKKIIWNIETEKYFSIKESVDNYLQTWKKWNLEFIEGMHLIESSLYEGSEDRRLNALDKSLSVMLEETYEKMLHYAQALKSPLTALHMLGIILPILGLVILPLVVSFMPEVKWYHLFTFYNIVLPIGVFYLSKVILTKRPTGYGDSDISESSKEMKKLRNILIKFGGIEIRISPLIISVIVGVFFLLIGFSPLIIHALAPNFDCSLGAEIICTNELTHPGAKYYLLGYRNEIIDGVATGNILGPYGLGATLLSLGIPIGVGLSVGLYFKLRSKNIIKIREETKKLEREFASALFQLGNRLGDGLPAEIAFSKVSEVMEGTISGKFFETVSTSIRKLGMSVEQAIFDPERGAINYFPSPLIESSMKVLIESSKKGPMIASSALINVSNYIKQMHRVDERLKDLMSDVISSMKAQISFLTPTISGIVIGITSMITAILGSLGEKLSELANQAEGGAAGGGLLSMFGSGVPTFYFQMIVGLYVVQIVYLLTVLINGVENGADKLNERFLIGKNMIKSAITYSVIAFIIMLIFNIIAGNIMGSVTDGLI